MNLDLPPFVWKPLAGEALTRADLAAIDYSTVETLKFIEVWLFSVSCDVILGILMYIALCLYLARIAVGFQNAYKYFLFLHVFLSLSISYSSFSLFLSLSLSLYLSAYLFLIHSPRTQTADADTFHSAIDENYSALLSDRQPVELLPGGGAMAVQFADRAVYTHLVEQARLHEHAPQVWATHTHKRDTHHLFFVSRFVWMSVFHFFSLFVCLPDILSLSLSFYQSILLCAYATRWPISSFFYCLLATFRLPLCVAASTRSFPRKRCRSSRGKNSSS